MTAVEMSAMCAEGVVHCAVCAWCELSVHAQLRVWRSQPLNLCFCFQLLFSTLNLSTYLLQSFISMSGLAGL